MFVLGMVEHHSYTWVDFSGCLCWGKFCVTWRRQISLPRPGFVQVLNPEFAFLLLLKTEF